MIDLHADTVKRINSRDYTPQQIELWIGKPAVQDVSLCSRLLRDQPPGPGFRPQDQRDAPHPCPDMGSVCNGALYGGNASLRLPPCQRRRCVITSI